jgi:hypothetical protein
MSFVALAILADLASIVPRLFAQTDTGTITGTASGFHRRRHPGRNRHLLTNTANGLKLTAVTNGAGEFKILAVPRGDYTVT